MSGIGAEHDVVLLRVGPYDSHYAESYRVQMGIFDTPSMFSVQFGLPAERVKRALSVTRARTPCELLIDGNPQFSGYIDEHGADGDASRSTVTISGRDRLSELFDRYVTAEQSFKGSTIVELVKAGMDVVYGQREGYTLSYSADVARAQMAGGTQKSKASGPAKLSKPQKFTIVGENFAVGASGDATTNTFSSLDIGVEYAVPLSALAEAAKRPIKTLEDAKDLMLFLRDETKKAASFGANAKPPEPTVMAKIGQRWFDGVIKPELDRAGLFLWHMGANNFLLAAPNVTQPPKVALVRRLNGKGNNVLSGQFRSNAMRRYSSVTVHAKAGSGAKSRAFKDGSAVDYEMLSRGYLRPFTMQDDKCKSDEQARALAHRAIAESRRAGWSLSYVVPGHSTIDDDGKRVVWTYDTTVHVIDEVLGVNAVAYIESVEHSGQPHKTTKLKLMRRVDALFGDGNGAPASE